MCLLENICACVEVCDCDEMKSVSYALMCVLVGGVCAPAVSTDCNGTLPGQAYTHTHTHTSI